MPLAGKDGFLRRGFTGAYLKWEGNILELSNTFIILVIGTINVWRQKEFSRNVGIGLRSQDVLGMMKSI